MKTLLLLGFALGAFAQEQASSVNQVDGPPPTAIQYVLGYSGTNLVYLCTAQSAKPGRNTLISISTISKASPAVVTSTGHGLPLNGSTPSVTISGATGTGWLLGVNGTFVAVPIDANTFSLYTTAGVAVDSSAFGTLAGTVVFSTTGPRLTVAEWSVLRLSYDGSSNLIGKYWMGGNQTYNQKCSEAASTTVRIAQ